MGNNQSNSQINKILGDNDDEGEDIVNQAQMKNENEPDKNNAQETKQNEDETNKTDSDEKEKNNNNDKEKPKKNDKVVKTLPQVVDYIATNYILTQNFRDLKKLADTDYCNELVVLTSKVIGQKLNSTELNYLAQRMKDGKEINEMTKDNIIFLKQGNLKNLDVKNSTTKRRMCIGIAKFYVQVAHLFAAIVTTINPVYTYVDSSTGEKKQVGLMDKRRIPKGVDVELKKVGLCRRRIDALVNKKELNPTSDDKITVKPNFCKMNRSKHSLEDEPGIKELDELYYDEYDYNNKEGFNKMSDEMKKEYEEDVKRFYMEFSGHSKVPENIKSFRDINLRQFHRSEGCQPGGIYTKGYTGSIKETLFKNYIDHIKQMIESNNASHEKLLAILDELFVFSYDQTENKKIVIINPAINEAKIQDMINKTRKIIVELYIKCEQDFINGLELYEAIVENQILATTKAQFKNLRHLSDYYATSEPLRQMNKGEEDIKIKTKQSEEADANNADANAKQSEDADANNADANAKQSEDAGIADKMKNEFETGFDNIKSFFTPKKANAEEKKTSEEEADANAKQSEEADANAKQSEEEKKTSEEPNFFDKLIAEEPKKDAEVVNEKTITDKPKSSDYFSPDSIRKRLMKKKE